MTNTRTAGEWNRRNRYLIHLKKLLKQLYLIEDKSSSDYKVLNAEIKGYLDAGLTTRIASEKDLQNSLICSVTAWESPPLKQIIEKLLALIIEQASGGALTSRHIVGWAQERLVDS